METSAYVSSGEQWQPESASRFNGISEMLNQIRVIGPSGPVAGSQTIFSISCVNRSSEKLHAHTYVTIAPPSVLPGSDSFSAVYSMYGGTADPCGVLLDDCDSGAMAEVQLYGVAEALPPHPQNIFKIPGSMSASGRELVLINCTGCTTYHNYFKVTPASFNTEGKISTVRICDGGSPDSGICGLTDVSAVAAAAIDVSGKYICLKLTANTFSGTDDFKDLSESFECLDSEPDENKPYVILAEIVDNGRSITQRWTAGRIYWRNRFIVPHYGDF